MYKKQLILVCLMSSILALIHTVNSKLYAEEKPVALIDFVTPYGNIQKGYTLAQVEQILGDPTYAKASKDVDIWYYYFSEDSRLFVYFKDGKVMDVSRSEYEKI